MNYLRSAFLLCLVMTLGKASNSTRPKVLISSPYVPQIASDLLSKCCDLINVQNGSKEEILSKVEGVDAILWASHLKIDKYVLDAAGSQMKTIGTMTAGYDHIDLVELRKRGIKLGNTPKVLNGAVADTAVLLGLAAARRLHEGRLLIDGSKWDPNEWILGQDIAGSTVGIIGLGGIGQAIAKRLKRFEVNEIIYTGHKEKPEGKELGARFIPLEDRDTLIKDSDFIFIAAPLTPETEGMCNEDFFSKMKKTAVFVNISRGKVVDQKALYKALKEGQIFAAGLDVMTPEPLPATDELLTLPNLVVLPHWGSATAKTRDAMAQLTAQNIIKGLNGEPMITPVV
ncbi:glyoxylate reductase/hydroxypyruvate reductase-like [Anoplophora glabripennis]|uniref:glyoxylate reductase/hydroxypyruvate reductase-like n=1 Tax=Anoplophora glabripennis TaxID=217634 RepID=UPI000874FBF3|nr:glyoxylate reductase/hydroxypyruvate reductase-like [Anoplophora glabripennis]